MKSFRTTDTLPTASSLVRRRALRAVSLLLAGGLALTGCAADVASTSGTASPSAGSDSSSSSTAADPKTGGTSSTTTEETISSTAAAADAFLATLSDEQRETVLYDYDDATKTTSWSNFPVTFVERAGLNLADLTDEQKTAALAVLQALLSDEAYDTVSGIMGGDEYLQQNSSSTEQSLGQYYIAFFGEPSDTGAFEVQFGGHHLGINATLDGATDAITFAPTHLGVQPAVYTDDDGNEVRPFDGIYTDAFAFFDSLTGEQQAALTSGDVSMCAPGDTCDFDAGAGLTGADLTDAQRQLLLDLIANWSGMADEQTTADSRAKIEATIDDTVIAWTGETTYDMSTGDGISFSISGPNVYVAFQAQQGSAGADVEGVSTSGWGHVHTIYRDPTNDYANSVTQQAASGMGGGTGPAGGPPGGGTPPDGGPPR
ncbi:DUF3500 domain-containing protein [Arthrobacter sp. zg-Y1110]|uniref:DUF3500 domain-containing protein n=1 Tax=Arthrobacter sp. zg-Y1110 TaxID=2886932 RepID=UPI001D14D0F6|nr:DUF3500 domain-containing protein [Arthrobacter sp. zg-Y1110]MCC3292147.1 DUF3500 domain-containing protein [Arthrobacter sp. zg-Y1110]UWX85236.1 DUF3500 domain-containing protein [Arthrobacter sp. zg-Y1110]